MIKIKARDKDYGTCWFCDKSGHKYKLYDVIAINDETEYEHTLCHFCMDCLSDLSKAIGKTKLESLGLGVRA